MWRKITTGMVAVAGLSLFTSSPAVAGQYDKHNPYRSFGSRSYAASQWQRQQATQPAFRLPQQQQFQATPQNYVQRAQPTQRIAAPARPVQQRPSTVITGRELFRR